MVATSVARTKLPAVCVADVEMTVTPTTGPTRAVDDVHLTTVKLTNNVDFVAPQSRSTVVPAIVMTFDDTAD